MTNIQRLTNMTPHEWDAVFVPGWTISQVLRELGCPSGDNRLRALVRQAANANQQLPRLGGSALITPERVVEAVRESVCMTDVCKALNVTACSFTYARIKKVCEDHAISTTHFDVSGSRRRGKKQYSFEEIFCERSSVPRAGLRAMAIRHGLFRGVCSLCGIGEWLGKPLTIELDHINGISDDNRVHNLRWLCPNCHSQTPTFRNAKARRTP